MIYARVISLVLIMFFSTISAYALESLEEIVITASRLNATATSTTIIDADDIEKSTGQTLVEILADYASVQLSSFYGGVNGAGTSISLRSFSGSDLLLLLNGRRLNPLDMSKFDLSTIPIESIARIEIIRGNSAAILYGDGAIGGAINIITKNELLPVNYGSVKVGSYGYFAAGTNIGRRLNDKTMVAAYGGRTVSDGYRRNNHLQQENATVNLEHIYDSGELYFNLMASNQDLGYPGARSLSPSGVVIDPSGSDTPNDNAKTAEMSANFGGSYKISDTVSFRLDGGIAERDIHGNWASSSIYDSSATQFSLRPQFNFDQKAIWAIDANIVAGIDLYDSNYVLDYQADWLNTSVKIQQLTIAPYFLETVAIDKDTKLSFGLRLQDFNLASAQDGADSKSQQEIQYAASIGLERQLNEQILFYVRGGRALRSPNIDEMVNIYGTPNFDLKAQTSLELEGGIEWESGRLSGQSSIYLTHLQDEIAYNYPSYSNINLDPTRRYGSENNISFQLNQDVALTAMLTFTNASFTAGVNKGKKIPLISAWTGSTGVSWNISDNTSLMGDIIYAGSRYFGGDGANAQSKIPPHVLVNVKLTSQSQLVQWSLALQNLLNQEYYDTGYYYGGFSAYPLPGIMLMGDMKVNF